MTLPTGRSGVAADSTAASTATIALAGSLNPRSNRTIARPNRSMTPARLARALLPLAHDSKRRAAWMGARDPARGRHRCDRRFERRRDHTGWHLTGRGGLDAALIRVEP